MEIKIIYLQEVEFIDPVHFNAFYYEHNYQEKIAGKIKQLFNDRITCLLFKNDMVSVAQGLISSVKQLDIYKDFQKIISLQFILLTVKL